jgi:hypothetical protein
LFAQQTGQGGPAKFYEKGPVHPETSLLPRHRFRLGKQRVPNLWARFGNAQQFDEQPIVKHGFEAWGTLENHPRGQRRVFLRKRLDG